MNEEKDIINIKIELPIFNCSNFSKNSEELEDVNLTDKEFATLVSTGFLHKETDKEVFNIHLSVLDKGTYDDTRSNCIDDIVNYIISESNNEMPVKEFIVDGFDVCNEVKNDFPDGEVPFSYCAKFLMDYIENNELYSIIVTLPPEENDDIK